MEVIERYPSLSDRSDEDKSRGEEQEIELLVSERGDMIERSATMSYDVIAKLVLDESFEIAVSPSIAKESSECYWSERVGETISQH